MNSNLHEWAVRNGISMQAFRDLQQTLGLFTPPLPDQHPGQGKSEAWASSMMLLEASRNGVRMFRNNSGALKDKDGRLVRFGLGNTSRDVNDVFKSPDYLGWRPVIIQPQHVGYRFGLTTLREMKAPGWQFNPDDAHEQAQWQFLAMAAADGCDAAFCTGEGTL